MFIQRLVVLFFLVTFLFFAGYSHAEHSAATDQILAKIDGSSITVDSFKAEMEKRGHGLPGSFAKPEQREALLAEMVRSEELYVSALKEGYDKKPEILEVLKRLIISRFREDNLAPELSNITVSEEDIGTYYKDHRSEFAEPEANRAAVIRISVPPRASDKKKAELLKRAEEARAEALTLGHATRSFGAVAVKYSDDQVSRYRGGDMGLMKRIDTTQLENEVVDTIFSLRKPGDISTVITTESGYYIVKLMEKRESGVRPLSDVKEIIRTKVLNEKKERVEMEFFKKLKAGIGVSVNTGLLESILPPGAGIVPEPPALPGGSRTRR